MQCCSSQIQYCLKSNAIIFLSSAVIIKLSAVMLEICSYFPNSALY